MSYQFITIVIICNSPNSLLWGSLLRKKRLVAICSGRDSGACPACVRNVSALCPPLVRLVLLALAAPPVIVRQFSALCPPCVVGFGRASTPRQVSSLCPACVVGFGRHVSALCPPCVRLLSAVAAPPPCVHLVSASCPLWPCLQTLSAMCPPYLVRHVSAFCPSGPRPQALSSALSPLWPLRRLQTLSAMCPPCVRFGFPPNLGRYVSVRPCVRLALYRPCVGFGRASKRCVSHVAPCVRHVSAPCLFFVLSLSACFSLFIRSLSVFGWVYGLALARPLSALRPLFGFCAFVCSVSVVAHLSRGLCGWAFACSWSGYL